MKTRYYAATAVFLGSLALLLLTVVDICRAFLFKKYFNIGSPSALFHLNAAHIPMALAGAIGVALSYLYWRHVEGKNSGSEIKYRRVSATIIAFVAIFLVIDLFVYRGVAASKILAAGKMGTGPGTLGMSWVIPMGSFPAWLRPAGDAVSYVLVNWQATILGLLIGGLFVVAGMKFISRMKGTGFMSHLLGAAMAVPQPFCACCASPVGSALYACGSDAGPVMAFVVSAPMLNITSLILASALLPMKYAVLRIAGGVIVGVLVTYAVSLLASRWVVRDNTDLSTRANPALRWANSIVSFYSRAFHFERLLQEDNTATPARLFSSWMRVTGRIAVVVLPLFFAGAIVSDYILQILPASGNNFAGVIATSFFGTLFMVPTWTEIALGAGMLHNGLNGPAAAALIVLPAINIPALLVIGAAFRSWKTVAILGAGIFIAGIIAGLIFL